MKKKDKKRNKSSMKVFATKLPVVIGGKRGRGHSKRQRLIKARLRLLNKWRSKEKAGTLKA